MFMNVKQMKQATKKKKPPFFCFYLWVTFITITGILGVLATGMLVVGGSSQRPVADERGSHDGDQ